jgi:ABC-type lipoprotein release transport system permease subunit
MTKHIKILEHALSSIVRRRFKNLAIIVAFSFTVSALATILFFTDSLKKEAENILTSAPDLIVQRTKGGRHDLIPVEYAEKIKKIPGVGEVTPRYWGYYYDAFVKANYTLTGLMSKESTLDFVHGRLPGASGEAAIGAGVADIRNSEVDGELILINSRNMGVLYEVVGVFSTDSVLLTNDLVVLSNDDIIDFFDLPAGQATDIAVMVYNSSEVQTVASKVKRLFPDTRPITKSELVRTYDMVFNWRSGMMIAVFSGAVIAFCIMAWDKATGISAEEKQEIGILKAIGWDTSDVLALKFWEGVIIALTSFFLGVIAGFVHVFFFDSSILAPIIKGWSVLFPDFRLTPHVNLYQLFVMGFLIITPYVVSTIIPAWKTAITDPDTVMRG